LLHYVWKNRLMPREGLVTTKGLPLQVLSVGLHNKDAGPDFFNADVMIGSEDWMGNVEIHTRSSDWFRHGHDKDKAYNNVVLHVVEEADTDIVTESGREVPQLILKVPAYVVSNYESLQAFEEYPPCYSYAAKVPKILSEQWIRRLCEERLERKAAEISQRLTYCEYDWERVFFITMARAFGFGLNGDTFEEWARTIPYTGAAKHRDNLFQIEALFFGQAGLLESDELNDNQATLASTDSYYQSLVAEYKFLANKFSLTPIGAHKWKFLRLRPQNFPSVRMAQFASLYFKQKLNLSAVVEATDIKELHKLLEIEVSEYWQRHYSLCTEETTRSGGQMQRQSLDLLVLNGIIPTIYAYAKYRDSKKLMDKAIEWLYNMPAEDNKHTRLWQQMGLEINSAVMSQALVQLSTRYCERKDCLRCQLGYQFIKKK